jgi:hypothetical protein
MGQALEGPRARVVRAKEHLNTLSRETAPFRGALHYGKDYTVATEFDPETRKFALRLDVLRPVPLLRFGILVGDVVHQCRSALDNLIEEATVAYSGAALPGTEFPVFNDPIAFSQRKKNEEPAPNSGIYAIRGIDPRLWDLVEKLQPYNKSASGSPRSLGVLHKFWNTDKHRFPAVVATSTLASFPKLNLYGVAGGSRDWVLMMMFPLEQGVKLVEGTLLADETPEEVGAGVKVRLSSNLEFDEGPLGPEAGKRYGVVESLRLGIKFTEAVIDDFSQFFP